ncbi:glycosyltransferase family 1 protein [Paenibacillus tritici]|uniref:glycosyltransferase family 1 protein n=1 Tax=Paenibacillus tritici TaxID=1873425 RepID=UPI001BA95372|nr:glycosyltransferase family 1 protein [Paenibacillus tritici]QUL53904.1 glycosyltransferase family 1 protein [Paenibacillus tritici]
MERILHVVSTIGINSGVMSFLMSYYRNINREEIQFDFLFWVDEDNSYAEEIRSLGGGVYKVQKPGFSRASLQSLLLFFKQNNGCYRIMHLHEVYLNMIVCPVARKYGFTHIISHCHTTKYSDKWINALRNRVLCLPLKSNVDEFFACSKDAGEFYYGKKKSMNGKVQIINNAIDFQKFSYDVEKRKCIREKMELNNKFVVGHVGRFNNQKNHDFLIDIFYEIHKKNNNAILLLVGIGPLEEKIKEKVRRKLPQNTVIFLGQIHNINEILQGIDVFILPSLFEGLGIVLIEAQMSGLRCITSDAVPKDAQITENIDFLSLELSAEKWADTAISNTIENRYIDRKKIADAGFDIYVESKKLVDCYLNII